MFFFFFSSRRRHTRCSRDWSSDVCSSDLVSRYRGQAVRPVAISVGLRPGQLGRRNARRVNSDEGVSSTQLRRSEERRVGKECRSRWAAEYEKKEKMMIEHKDKLQYAQISP